MSLSIYHHYHTSGQDYRKRQERKTSRSYFTEEDLTPILAVRMGSRVNEDKPKSNGIQN